MTNFKLYAETTFNKPKLLVLSTEDVWAAKYKWVIDGTEVKTQFGPYKLLKTEIGKLLGYPANGIIIQANGDYLNFSRENLRLLEMDKVQYERLDSGKLSRFIGVTYQASRKKPWLAQLTVAGTRVLQKYYATEVEAALAYNGALIGHLGYTRALASGKLNEFIH
jgi:hypothetical protein